MAKKFSWDKFEEAKAQEPTKSFNWDSFEETKPEKSLGQQAADAFETTGRSFLSGATAGLSEPVFSGLNALSNHAGNAIDGKSNLFDMDKLKSEYQGDVNRRLQMKNELPISDIGGEITGAVVPSPVNIGGKLFKGAEALSGGIKGTGAIAKTIRAASTGALGGIGYEGIKQASGVPTGFQDGNQSFDKIKDAALLGGGISGGLVGIGEAGKAVASGGKKLAKQGFSSMFGVSENAVEKYLKNSGRINATPEFEEVLATSREKAHSIHNQVSNAELTAKEANLALKELKSGISDKLKLQRFEAKDAHREAKNIVEASVKKAKEAAAFDMVRTVDDLKSSVKEQSSQAWKQLEGSKSTFSVRTVKGKVTQAINSLKVGGKDGAVIGSASEGSLASLQKFRDQLDQLPPKASMKEMKQIIQRLDQDISYSNGAGQFLDPASREKLAIRTGLDSALKSRVPEYGEIMAPLAEDTRLLGQASKNFGDERKALGALNRIDGETGKPVRDLVDQFGKRTNRNFIDAIDETRVPEYGDMVQKREFANRYDAPGTMDSEVQRLAGQSPEAMAQMKAQSAYDAVSNKFEPVKGLYSNPDSASLESKLKSILRGNSQTNKDVMSKFSDSSGLTDQYGRNITDLADDMGVKEAFQKGDMQGSRNVNAWALLASAFGMVTAGPVGAVTAGGAGAVAGKVMDAYGPRLGKQILDQVIKLGNKPTTQAIQNLAIPQAVKEQLYKGMQRLPKSFDGTKDFPKAADANSYTPDKTAMSVEDARNHFVEGN